ncbi:MAG: putative dynein heavy chain [Streblomastix strix]|uniref:Putative dynein heavy chain n=1 Tax=Streblomastix strix TaxID=222440 RepID=A0A5J4WU54_9EUKA|nr:MAG: putative dynein heavy chain [Streblomastix strix]
MPINLSLDRADEKFAIIRVEIIVDYPANLDISTLSVVDPNNPSTNGFKFIEIDSEQLNQITQNNRNSTISHKSTTEQKTAVAVPAFCVLDGDQICYYSVHHSTLGWKHGIKPRLHKNVNDDDKNDGIITFKVKLTTETGIIRSNDYIQFEQKDSLTPSFYAALESIQPSVPESALHGSFELIKRLNENSLINLILNHPGTTVFRYSLDILSTRDMTIAKLASKFKEKQYSLENPLLKSAVFALSYFKNIIEQKMNKNILDEPIIVNQQLGDGQTKGFLCDKKDLFTTNVISETLFEDTAKWIESIQNKKQHLIYADQLLQDKRIFEKIPRFIDTKNAKERLDLVTYALRSTVPLLIQGPTSASKSLTAQIASVGLYNEFPLIYALSEQTEVGDLLGRKMLRRKGTSMLSYVPGVLAEAYGKGRVLLLDEFDLCPPKVLSSILSSLDGNTIEIEGKQIVRHQNFRVIATLNGETDGFTSQQRNILPSEILARFHTISFPEMNREECNEIFNKLLKKSKLKIEDKSKEIGDIHIAVSNYYTANERIDKSRGMTAITLRNFSFALDLMVLGNIQPRDACSVVYLAQIPTVDRVRFDHYLDAIGKVNNFQQLRNEISMAASQQHIHPHPQFIDAAFNAIVGAQSGLHVLLEGPSGCGLSTLAKFIAWFCTKEIAKESKLHQEIPSVQLGPESTVEDIIGSFKPQAISGNETDMTKLVQWQNGPLLIAGEIGMPVILDRIDEAKAQVIERINPVLEKNSQREKIKFLVPEKGEAVEQEIKQGFVVISTLTINENRQTPAISLALRNRFVTVAVESPKLQEQQRAQIAKDIISKNTKKMQTIKNDGLPTDITPKIPDDNDISHLAEAISRSLPDTTTIRDISLLVHTVCFTFGIVKKLTTEEQIELCKFQPKSLASEAAETFVQRTLKIPTSRQRFFYEGDKNSPMWQVISALSIASISGQPVFLKGEPGCGKTEAIRHFSINRKFHPRNPVFSVSCSSETTAEQFIGSLVFEKNGFRFVEGPLVQAARQGFVFLADEFNLLTPAVMISLIPFLSARPGDTFIHPDIRDPITVSSGFLFVATGNEESEKGRVKLPEFVKSNFQHINVQNPSPEQLDGLIESIMNVDYSTIDKSILQPSQLRNFMDELKETLHIK